MSRCRDVVDAYIRQLADGFSCLELEDASEVLLQTPYTFSDGDSLEVLISDHQNHVTLTDFGQVVSRLEQSGINVQSPSLRGHIGQALRGFRVDIVGEALRVEGREEQLSDMLLRLVGAMREVDALSHLRPQPRAPVFEKRVLSHLRTTDFEVVDHPLVVGRSGSTYRVTAEVFGEIPTLVQAVAGGKGEAGIRAIDHAYRIFSDVNGERDYRRKVAVLSQEEQWRPEDITLLASSSYVAAWWDLDAFDDFLRGDRPSDRRLFASQPVIDFAD